MIKDPTKPQTTGARITTLRVNHPEKLNQTQLGAKIEALLPPGSRVSQSKVSSWELDEGLPDAAEIRALARFFAVSADYLCCVTDEASGLQPGKWIVDMQMVSDFERADRVEQVKHHIKREGVREFVDFRTEIPSGARVVDRAEAERLRAQINERWRTLKKGGRRR